MPRVPALDGLRAVAVILVVAFHTNVAGFDGGFIGVDIFFVLSGFLITGILAREATATGRIDRRRFLWRRLGRLYPALLVLFALFLLAAPFLFPEANPPVEVLIAGIYLSDYGFLLLREPWTLRHTWSLAVEMQFYLLWPPVLVVLLRRAPKHAAALLLLLFLLATAWRWGSYEAWGGVHAYYSFDTRLSGLLLGSALALVDWRPSDREVGLASVLASLLLGVAVITFRFPVAPALTWGEALVDVASAVLVVAATMPGTWVARSLSLRPLIVLGRWSYGIYLFHYPVALLTRDRLEGPVSFAITMAFATIAAGLSFEFFERHAAKWFARRFTESGSRESLSYR